MASIPYPANIRQPIWGSGKDVTPKVNKNEFGDGYVERFPDGINHISEKWNITYKNLLTAEKNAIEAFFYERGGYKAFDWAPPAEPVKKFCATSWKFTPTEAGYWDGGANFEQVFDYL